MVHSRLPLRLGIECIGGGALYHSCDMGITVLIYGRRRYREGRMSGSGLFSKFSTRLLKYGMACLPENRNVGDANGLPGSNYFRRAEYRDECKNQRT